MKKYRLYFKLAITNIIRRKLNILNILVLTLSIVILVLTLSASKSVNGFLSEVLQNSVDFRTILLNLNDKDPIEVQEELLKVDNITRIFPFISNNGAKIETIIGDDNNLSLVNGEVFLKPYISNASPDILVGEEMREDLNNIGIIPEHFYPDQGVDIGSFNSSLNYTNGEQLIGKTMVLKYKVYAEDEINNNYYSFIVGGIYDATTSTDSPSTIYLPYNDMLMLNESFQKIEDVRTYAVVVDNYNNVSNVMRELRSLGYYPSLKSIIQGGIPQLIIDIGFILFFIVSTVSMVIVIINTINSINKRETEIALMKTFGYNDSELFKVLLWEITTVCTLSIFLSAIVSASLMVGANIYITNYFSVYFADLKFHFNDYSNSVIYSFVLGCIFLISTGLAAASRLTAINPKILTRT